MASRLPLLLLAILTLSGCGPSTEVEQEIAIQVLTELEGELGSVKMSCQSNIPIFFKEPDNCGPEDCWSIGAESMERSFEVFPSLHPKTWKNFEAVNSRAYDLCSIWSLPSKFGVNSSTSSQLVELSRVGLGSDSEQALVYAGSLDGRNARGWMLLMEKNEGKWVVAGRVLVWIV